MIRFILGVVTGAAATLIALSAQQFRARYGTEPTKEEEKE